MPEQTPGLFSFFRSATPSTQKRIDLGIIVSGFVVALILGVLTWINYQNRDTPDRVISAPPPTDAKHPQSNAK